MSRPDLTDITVILDRSGSMEELKAATIEAFNQFLLSQRDGAGSARMTLVQFDDRYESVYEAQPIETAPALTSESYQPRGSTALLDAIGRSLRSTRERLDKIDDSNRPGSVIIVIQTDGLENASRSFTIAQINDLIAELRDEQGWQFIFLGANQDAIQSAVRMGMSADGALTYNGDESGTRCAFDLVSKKVRMHRERRAAAEPNSIGWTDEERRKASPGQAPPEPDRPSSQPPENWRAQLRRTIDNLRR